jgi:hypothetical protein
VEGVTPLSLLETGQYYASASDIKIITKYIMYNLYDILTDGLPELQKFRHCAVCRQGIERSGLSLSYCSRAPTVKNSLSKSQVSRVEPLGLWEVDPASNHGLLMPAR